MMVNVETYYANEIKKIINQDKSTFTGTRNVEVDDGFGGKTISKKTTTFEGRLYNKKSVRDVLDISGDAVGYSSMSAEKILTLTNADILEDDEITVGNRRYRIRFIRDFLSICYQIELEVIS